MGEQVTHETSCQHSLHVLTPDTLISPSLAPGVAMSAPPSEPFVDCVTSILRYPTKPSSTSSHRPVRQSATISSEHVSVRGLAVVGLSGTGVTGRAQTTRPQSRQ